MAGTMEMFCIRNVHFFPTGERKYCSCHAITMQNLHNSAFSIGHNTVVDPDLELRGGPSFALLALLAFLPSFISSYLPKIGGREAGVEPLRLL